MANYNKGMLKRWTCKHCRTTCLTVGGGSYFLCETCRLDAPIGSAWGGTGGAMATNDVHKAILDGVLPPASDLQCVDCGHQAAHYDHRDYNRPLDVAPVCCSCNLKRGPAIPRKGFFAHMFAVGCAHYRSRRSMVSLLHAIGIDVDASTLPRFVGVEHWLPFKDALLEWEAKLSV